MKRCSGLPDLGTVNTRGKKRVINIFMLTIIFDPANSGGTFLNWSLHYLSAQKKHYFVDGSSIDISEYPLVDGLNAHGHKTNSSNRPGDLFFDQQYKLLDKNNKSAGIKILHFYSRGDINEGVTLNACVHDGGRVIVLAAETDHFRHRFRGRSFEYLDFDYFRNFILSQNKNLDPAKISTPGLLREFIVFNMRKWDNDIKISVLDIVGRSVDNQHYFVLKKEDLLTKSEQALRECMQWLGLKIDEQRVKIWLTVAESWAADVLSHQKNDARWNHMVEAIVLGKDFHCGRLSLMQEGALIYDVLVSSGCFVSARHFDMLPDNAREINKLIKH